MCYPRWPLRISCEAAWETALKVVTILENFKEFVGPIESPMKAAHPHERSCTAVLPSRPKSDASGPDIERSLYCLVDLPCGWLLIRRAIIGKQALAVRRTKRDVLEPGVIAGQH